MDSVPVGPLGALDDLVHGHGVPPHALLVLADPAVVAVQLADVGEFDDAAERDVVAEEALRDRVGVDEEGLLELGVAAVGGGIEEGLHLGRVHDGDLPGVELDARGGDAEEVPEGPRGVGGGHPGVPRERGLRAGLPELPDHLLSRSLPRGGVTGLRLRRTQREGGEGPRRRVGQEPAEPCHRRDDARGQREGRRGANLRFRKDLHRTGHARRGAPRYVGVSGRSTGRAPLRDAGTDSSAPGLKLTTMSSSRAHRSTLRPVDGCKGGSFPRGEDIRPRGLGDTYLPRDFGSEGPACADTSSDGAEDVLLVLSRNMILRASALSPYSVPFRSTTAHNAQGGLSGSGCRGRPPGRRACCGPGVAPTGRGNRIDGGWATRAHAYVVVGSFPSKAVSLAAASPVLAVCSRGGGLTRERATGRKRRPLAIPSVVQRKRALKKRTKT